jgi:hypothetical protein
MPRVVLPIYIFAQSSDIGVYWRVLDGRSAFIIIIIQRDLNYIDSSLLAHVRATRDTMYVRVPDCTPVTGAQ